MQIIVVSFLAWFIAQLAKFSIQALRGKPNFKLFYQSGGMPSAHAATVSALAVSTLALEGVNSPIFGLSAVLAAIVIYDSLGIRRASGEQSVVINSIIKTVGNIKPIREVLGHKPSEVLFGMALGIASGLLLTFPSWSDEFAFLTMAPTAQERFTYLIFFTALTLMFIIVRLVLSRLRKVSATKSLQKAAWWSLGLPGLLGLFFSLLQFENIPTGRWRLWAILLVVSVVAAQGLLYLFLYRFAGFRYQEQKSSLLQKKLTRRKIKKPKRKR